MSKTIVLVLTGGYYLPHIHHHRFILVYHGVKTYHYIASYICLLKGVEFFQLQKPDMFISS